MYKHRASQVTVCLWQHGDRSACVGGRAHERETALQQLPLASRLGSTAASAGVHTHALCVTAMQRAQRGCMRGVSPRTARACACAPQVRGQRRGRVRRARSWRSWCPRASWACRRPCWRGPQPNEAPAWVPAHCAGLCLTATAPGLLAARGVACADRVAGQLEQRGAHHLAASRMREYLFPLVVDSACHPWLAVSGVPNGEVLINV